MSLPTPHRGRLLAPRLIALRSPAAVGTCRVTAPVLGGRAPRGVWTFWLCVRCSSASWMALWPRAVPAGAFGSVPSRFLRPGFPSVSEAEFPAGTIGRILDPVCYVGPLEVCSLPPALPAVLGDHPKAISEPTAWSCVLERRKETRNTRLLPTSFPDRAKQTQRVFCPSDCVCVLRRLRCAVPPWVTGTAPTRKTAGQPLHVRKKPATRAVAVKSGGRFVFLKHTTLHF